MPDVRPITRVGTEFWKSLDIQRDRKAEHASYFFGATRVAASCYFIDTHTLLRCFFYLSTRHKKIYAS